jgi:LAO/AO transport system kinase
VQPRPELRPELRRNLTKRLSALLSMSAVEALSAAWHESARRARRVGFSGPPGSGKSSLIAAWAQRRLLREKQVGVLAIDPSSPISTGSVLGDRVRMDAVMCHPTFFLRSVPSRSVHDGLCPNAGALLDAFDDYSFDDVVLETVGVGQTDYAARTLVDTFVLVLNPNSGDVVQAMKAGILELADVLVVNKCDLPGADSLVRELSSVIALRRPGAKKPPVVPVSTREGTGLDTLTDILDRDAIGSSATDVQTVRERRRYALQAAFVSGITELLNHCDERILEEPPRLAWSQLLQQLQRLANSPA